mmetsp:Transcript_93696/g.279648  ORF Transcript_93696/g.279648 Transcript_93696/m.279648 type:complete len:208 (-) Transcript_93696:238-861(-)
MPGTRHLPSSSLLLWLPVEPPSVAPARPPLAPPLCRCLRTAAGERRPAALGGLSSAASRWELGMRLPALPSTSLSELPPAWSLEKPPGATPEVATRCRTRARLGAASPSVPDTGVWATTGTGAVATTVATAAVAAALEADDEYGGALGLLGDRVRPRVVLVGDGVRPRAGFLILVGDGVRPRVPVLILVGDGVRPRAPVLTLTKWAA